MRLDKALVESGLVSTRSQALQQIQNGNVRYRGEIVSRASLKVDQLDELSLGEQEVYVGRGALKLKKALEVFNLSPEGKITADIGASTGGFTQILLQRGAQKVFAIDVGRDQLAAALREDSRVINLEQTNIRDFPSKQQLSQPVALAVVDLSFISLTLCLAPIVSQLAKNADVIALVKPQFEVGRDKLGKNGVVKNSQWAAEALENVYHYAKELKLSLLAVTPSPIKGKSGNSEFLFHLRLGPRNEKSFNFSSLVEGDGE